MGCCGEKRKAWMEESQRSAATEVPNNDPAPEPGKEERIFEYTGNRAMHINGAVSGRDYFFRFPGDKVTVDHMDSYAMMAELDLRLVS